MSAVGKYEFSGIIPDWETTGLGFRIIEGTKYLYCHDNGWNIRPGRAVTDRRFRGVPLSFGKG